MKIARIAAIAVGLFCVAQLIPYGRDHTNPLKLAEPEWDSPGTRTLFFRGCHDCHSNETSWPWYSFVAPISWLVQHDVNEGRSHFNVSEWGHGKQHGDEAAKMIRDEEMPLWYYRPLHSNARLSPKELKEFITGLEKTFGSESAGGDHGDHEH